MPKLTSVRLQDELLTKLDRLAAAMDRPRAWLIEQAIARYVDEESWQVDAISEALGEYRSGQRPLRSHQEVMIQLAERMRVRAGDAGSLA